MVNDKWGLIAILILGAAVNMKVSASQDVMKKMSTTFFKLLMECKQELSIDDNILEGLARFWSVESDLGARELGCVIICMASKHDLMVSGDFKMHHENSYKFARDHGADDETAKQIVKIIHDCEEQFASNADHCARVMETSRCFRDEIRKLDWAPTMDVLVGELIGEM